MNNHANNTFDELIEAMWAGDLNEAGLAAWRPLRPPIRPWPGACGKRTDLSPLMAGHGPNRAPTGLAQAVFARLDLDPSPPPSRRPTRARPIVPRSIWSRRVPLGLAAAALAVVFIHVKWLLNRDRLGGDTIAQVRTVPAQDAQRDAVAERVGAFCDAQAGPDHNCDDDGASPSPSPCRRPSRRPPRPPTPSRALPNARVRVDHRIAHGHPDGSVEAATRPRPVGKQIMRAITEAAGRSRASSRFVPPPGLAGGRFHPAVRHDGLVERLGHSGSSPPAAAAVLPYQFGVMQGAGLLRRAETTTATRHASMPAQHSAPIPLTVMIEETPLKK